MEIPESTFTVATAVLLAVLLVALLMARLITPHERRLVASTAITLAGLFFVARSAGDPVATAVGASGWAVGLGTFAHGVLTWSTAAGSRVGPLAAIFLLPPAFFGAVLLDGLAISLLSR
ncbi:MAG TPA: hypothetical protein VF158_03660 [Longimicrobiales bacterium]